MPKGEDKKLAALAKKNAAKATKAKAKTRRYDPTLPPEDEDDPGLRKFFSEMKKRDF